jgi:hypothetical protein
MDSQPFGATRGIPLDSQTGAPATGGGPGWGALAGAGLSIGGGLLNYLGERQGSKAMLSEAQRQAAEQSAMSEARHQALIQALGRYNPAAQGVQTGIQTGVRTAASQPAIAAGGAALGLNGGQMAGVGQALLPTQRIAGSASAQDLEAQRMQQNKFRHGQEQGSIDDAANFARQLYPQRTQIAGQRGSDLRLAGSMAQGFGMPLMALGMAQPNRAG